MLGVSETTVAGDMEALGDWFARNHLEVIRRPGYGVILSGSEGGGLPERPCADSSMKTGPAAAAKGSNSSALGSAGSSRPQRHTEEAVTDILLNISGSGIYSLLNNDILARGL